jgi:hypothetical protein
MMRYKINSISLYANNIIGDSTQADVQRLLLSSTFPISSRSPEISCPCSPFLSRQGLAPHHTYLRLERVTGAKGNCDFVHFGRVRRVLGSVIMLLEEEKGKDEVRSFHNC